uniref:nitric oxide dioxygenase n=1 Tax=Giardia intestinalis TaxID=5741 RepID=A0A7H0M255_GIAIN|nr:flavohemoprotein [Giardia intestinalis]QNQ16057.1 flavohemoprotein [Giardia intestinalis]QNQ16058.1 flavohemoprotein [Giardia intestinalis]
MPLSEDTIKAVEATADLVAAQGLDFTRAFYERMLTRNEELKDIFNLSHQRDLRQPKALLDSLVAYARSIRKINELHELREQGLPVPAERLAELQGFFAVAERIAHKHASVGIQPAQYQIVGAHLLATIEERVTADKAILAAWSKAYDFLAHLFVRREEEIYTETESSEGGWRQTRSFRVEEKVQVTERIFRFRLVPAEKGTAVALHKPGQYLAVFVRDPRLSPHRQIRQYSIISAPNHTYYEIAVHRDKQATVSGYLHDHVAVGDLLELAPPYGDFFLEYREPGGQAADGQPSPEPLALHGGAVNFAAERMTPIVLISGGIGQTPLLSMLRFLAEKEGQAAIRPIFWIHAAHDSRARAFKAEVDAIKVTDLPGLRTTTFLSEVDETMDKKGEDYDFAGRISLDRVPGLAELEADGANPHYFFVGPAGFMVAVEQQLKAWSVPEDRIHFEMFGPFKPLQ